MKLLLSFRVIYCSSFLNIGQQNGLVLNYMIDISTFRVWDYVTGTSQFSTFSKKLIDDWCNFSKTVSHKSQHGFKRMFDFNWQVRICLDVLLGVCQIGFCTTQKVTAKGMQLMVKPGKNPRSTEKKMKESVLKCIQVHQKTSIWWCFVPNKTTWEVNCDYTASRQRA